MKDQSLEKKNGELVRKQVAERLRSYGFAKTKPAFYTRLCEDRIEFIHLHKFRTGPSFRVHTGIRFLIDDMDVVALNGIQASGFKNEYPVHYHFSYHKDEDTVLRCAEQIVLFIENEALPWFTLWHVESNLTARHDSPLRSELAPRYSKFKSGIYEEKVVLKSKTLLGIKP
ncbi:hypothetical protein ACE6ED_27070 [Paenibacillus sp. CN-4]|uniref:hypothetical protein n=1 Tax=Paenibacillus nanchangensis TaxID=3348343 RepID=UPI00397BA2A9